MGEVIPERTEEMAVHAMLVPGGYLGRILYFGGYDVTGTPSSPTGACSSRAAS